MSVIRAALYARLTDPAEDVYPLAALRVYPIRAPQNGDVPLVTFRRMNEPSLSAFGNDPSLREAYYELRAWADTADAVEALADAIDATLRRWRKTSAPVVQDVFIDRGDEDYDEEAGRFFSQLFARIFYEAS